MTHLAYQVQQRGQFLSCGVVGTAFSHLEYRCPPARVVGARPQHINHLTKQVFITYVSSHNKLIYIRLRGVAISEEKDRTARFD
ncbi:hypothetical protein Pcinc_003397 [Petrolisthes cinctipes]|uniref:Uncharacterized protein n=1 Tax=Petrolisthes cinctipes TaxID=88211 RepID=A0AAE1L1D9_PETCI|nr:hypothetical protein Pcinc_003397 [Petrolisthes cinctipes]